MKNETQECGVVRWGWCVTEDYSERLAWGRGVVSATLDLPELQAYREKLPSLADMRRGAE
jgi:hypothetical protein